MSLSTSQSQHVLVDAKEEFVARVTMMTPPLYKEFKRICSFGRHEADPMKAFQTNLSRIPRWTPNNIDRHYRQIQQQNECEWIENLITAVFVSHAKVMAAIRPNHSKAVDISVPSGKTFVHRCYIETARKFWKRPDLFFHKYAKIDLQRNMYKSEKIISKSVRETVRKMLPVKTILEEYLDKSEITEESYCNDNISEAMSASDKMNLKKLVNKEVASATLQLTTNINDDTFSNFKIGSENPRPTDVKVEDITSTEMYPERRQMNGDEDVQDLSSIYLDLASEQVDTQANTQAAIEQHKHAQHPSVEKPTRQ